MGAAFGRFGSIFFISGGHERDKTKEEEKKRKEKKRKEKTHPPPPPPLSQPPPPPPPGFRAHEDKLDGYSFLYPDDWIPVTTSGNDVFYRSPLDVDTNLFVDVSSPSSSKYESVADLGSPQEAAEKTLKQYLTELMSTRIGVRRSGEVLSASARELSDEELARYDGGNTSKNTETSRLYYDVVVRMRSVASRNQLAVSKAEVDAGDELEWERDFRAVLGVAGKRLYELRLQSPTTGSKASASSPVAGRVNPALLDAITRSFRCREVQA